MAGLLLPKSDRGRNGFLTGARDAHFMRGFVGPAMFGEIACILPGQALVVPRSHLAIKWLNWRVG